jgi:hypothetical protein
MQKDDKTELGFTVKELTEKYEVPKGKEYKGSKWGKYLRAPAVYWKILERAGDKLFKLSDAADVVRGFTSGANEFFYVKEVINDICEDELIKKFDFNLSEIEQKNLRIIECADGSKHLIEKRYLKPLIKSFKEIKSYAINTNETLKFRVISIDEKIKNSRLLVADYVSWGKRRNYPLNPTCSSRNLWYKLPPQPVAKFLYNRAWGDRLGIPEVSIEAFFDCRFYGIYPKTDYVELGAILNTTFMWLFAELTGRSQTGAQPILYNTAYELLDFYILNPTKLTEKIKVGLQRTFTKFKKRPILSIFKEIALYDRQELDSLVLEALGFTDPKERGQVLNELYEAVTTLVRERLEKAKTIMGKEEE